MPDAAPTGQALDVGGGETAPSILGATLFRRSSDPLPLDLPLF
ncbi:hypothetical protein ACTHPH_19395 [Paenibacillus pasadenensis]|uniref:Uncharacterized protein n=1 Tax=Paenibacillus pasadenensis TaxID=217090 RepID=A0A2N5N2W8_9BACL|nr:hypothetical protein B8V81_3100 [Paenibacillus pasadenensis]